MTARELQDLLEKHGYRAEIREEESGCVNIITQETVSRHLQEVIESCVAAGVKVMFTVKAKSAMPLPKSLYKWHQQITKDNK